jgi:hypothetical protein
MRRWPIAGETVTRIRRVAVVAVALALGASGTALAVPYEATSPQAVSPVATSPYAPCDPAVYFRLLNAVYLGDSAVVEAHCARLATDAHTPAWAHATGVCCAALANAFTDETGNPPVDTLLPTQASSPTQSCLERKCRPCVQRDKPHCVESMSLDDSASYLPLK